MKIRIVTTARATIEETWTVEASSASDAYEKLLAGDGTLVLEDERTLGDEEDRRVDRMAPLDGAGVELDDLPSESWYEDSWRPDV